MHPYRHVSTGTSYFVAQEGTGIERQGKGAEGLINTTHGQIRFLSGEFRVENRVTRTGTRK